MVLASRPTEREDLDDTFKLANKRNSFFARAIREESAGPQDAARVMEQEKCSDKDKWLQAEAEGPTWAPHGASVIVVDHGGVCM